MTREVRYYVDARERTQAGDATKYFKHAAEELKPGHKVFLLCRESIEGNRSKLAHQEANLCRPEVTNGAEVVGCYSFVGPGYEHDFDYSDRPSWFAHIFRAVQRAHKLGATHLLMESVDRGVRSPLFHPKRGSTTAQAREWDLKYLQKLTAPLVLVTDLHPGATAAEESAYRNRRGKRFSTAKIGRPTKKVAGYKKAIRTNKMPTVMRLHGQGLSHREIAAKTGVPRATVQRWILIA